MSKINVILSRENYGANIYVGVKGLKDDIVRFFNGVYNWGGCSAHCELEWIGQIGSNGSSAYLAKFQTNEERFVKSLYNINLSFLTNSGQKIETITARREARRLTQKTFNNMNHDPFLIDERIRGVAEGW